METVVFTNGCFDLIHPGHVYLLKKARSLGTQLIVGLNSDRSVRALKGSQRPFLNEEERSAILKEFRSVNEVIIFDENTPERLIREIKPDVLVKGGDWTINQIVGADFVLKSGGKVFSIPFVNDISTSKIAEKINSDEKQSLDQTDKNFENQEELVRNSIRERIDVLKTILNQEAANISHCFDLIKSIQEKGNKALIWVDETSLFMNSQFELNRLLDNFALKQNASDSASNEPNALKGEISAHFINTGKEFRQKANNEDILIAVVNSDKNSDQTIEIIMEARQANCTTLAITGANGKKLASLCDANISVPSSQGFQIGEIHLVILHLFFEVISDSK